VKPKCHSSKAIDGHGTFKIRYRRTEITHAKLNLEAEKLGPVKRQQIAEQFVRLKTHQKSQLSSALASTKMKSANRLTSKPEIPMQKNLQVSAFIIRKQHGKWGRLSIKKLSVC